MRDEQQWETCPRCGRDALVTWRRTYAHSGHGRLRASVRIDVRCVDPGCVGTRHD